MVIPTIGRSRLGRAVRSALGQREVDVELVIVADLADADRASLGLEDVEGRVRILPTGGGRGAGFGRRLGTEAVEAPWVAYLDDDDVWLPEKLATQVAVAQAAPVPTIVACQMASRSRGHDVVAPRTVFEGGRDGLARYLFHRRRVGIDRNVIPTPSLLCPTDVARTIGWDPDLRRHQDWDFLLRAEAAGVPIVQLGRALVVVDSDSDRKVTSSADWAASLAWARGASASWDRETYVDFLIAQPLRYALQARSAEGVRAVLGEARGTARPSARALAIGAGGLVPRHLWVPGLHRLRARGSVAS